MLISDLKFYIVLVCVVAIMLVALSAALRNLVGDGPDAPCRDCDAQWIENARACERMMLNPPGLHAACDTDSDCAELERRILVECWGN